MSRLNQFHNHLLTISQHATLLNFGRTKLFPTLCFSRRIVLQMNGFQKELLYILSISTLGFLILRGLSSRTELAPRNIDLFFTSVSAVTLSSMSTVEMEAFSNNQLIVMAILIFLGGEVFLSGIGLLVKWFKSRRSGHQCHNKLGSMSINSSPATHQIELAIVIPPKIDQNMESSVNSGHYMLIDSIKFLGFLVLAYIVIIQVLGFSLVLLAINLATSSKHLLEQKGINQLTFAVFTTISTFSNCGFVPTNENMIVFKQNSGLLLILIPQILFGNTLFPCCLRVSLWVLAKFFDKSEARFLLQSGREIGFRHLLQGSQSWFLAATAMGFLLLQFVSFCSMQWNSTDFKGLSTFEKFVASLFQCVNSRHAGENIVDLSTIAPALLVLFLVMMYLPPYTTFLPINDDNKIPQESAAKNKGRLVDDLLFSPLTYLAISIFLICITEWKGLKDDPLNFSVLHITVEVISAYGNVGFTTGYSCERQLKADQTCVNKSYGFSGKWTDEGKLIIILVMLFGRLKKHSPDGGKAWKLL